MPQPTADALARAYVFLRRVEHRIQYLDDQQTHVLPTRDDDLAWIARTMGYPDCCAFLHELDAHRELVAQEFDTLLGGNGKKQCSKGGCGGPRAAAPPPPELEALLEQLPPVSASAWPSGATTRAYRACATRRVRGCSAWCSAPPSGSPRAG